MNPASAPLLSKDERRQKWDRRLLNSKNLNELLGLFASAGRVWSDFNGLGMDPVIEKRWEVLSFLGEVQDLSPELVKDIYLKGDLSEQISILHLLARFSFAKSLTDLCLLGIRSNSEKVFKAIALNNIFPNLYLSQAEYNNMVLKALFLNLPVNRIQGLVLRMNPDLERSVLDYKSELTSAGRNLPEGIPYILNLIRKKEIQI